MQPCATEVQKLLVSDAIVFPETRMFRVWFRNLYKDFNIIYWSLGKRDVLAQWLINGGGGGVQVGEFWKQFFFLNIRGSVHRNYRLKKSNDMQQIFIYC